MSGAVPLSHFASWLAHGERGLSSEAIVSTVTGGQIGRYSPFGAEHNYPRDPDDFRRCERLLRAYPLARLHLVAMKANGPVWSRFVDEWDDVVALIESEVPGIFDGAPNYGARSPLGYARMRTIIDEARKAAVA